MEAEENPKTTSLFPVLHHQPSLPACPTPTATATATETRTTVPRWLSNSSFTTDLSLINDAVSSHYPATTALQSPSDEGDDGDVDAAANDRKPTYDLVDSFASDRDSSDSDDERARKKRRKDKKKKRKRRDRSTEASAAYDSYARKSDVRHWASSSASTPTDKDYYFDSRGDRDNLAFGCLYRLFSCKNCHNFCIIVEKNLNRSIYDFIIAE